MFGIPLDENKPETSVTHYFVFIEMTFMELLIETQQAGNQDTV